MKKNLLSLIGCIFISTACARVRPMPPANFHQVDKTNASQDSEALYQKFHVVKTDGLVSQIDGKYYSADATKIYYMESGAEEAAQLVNFAIEKNHSGKKVIWESAGAGLILGAVGAFGGAGGFGREGLGDPSQAYWDTSGYMTVFVTIGGAVGGAILGGLTGWSIFKLNHQASAKKSFSQAAETFNSYLKKQLKISFGVNSGLTIGSLQLTY